MLLDPQRPWRHVPLRGIAHRSITAPKMRLLLRQDVSRKRPQMQALTRTTRRPRSWPPPTSWEVNSSEPSHSTPPMPKTPHLGLRLARRLAGGRPLLYSLVRHSRPARRRSVASPQDFFGLHTGCPGRAPALLGSADMSRRSPHWSRLVVARGAIIFFRVRTLLPRAARQHSATTKSKGLFYTLSASNSTPESEVKLLGCTRRSF